MWRFSRWEEVSDPVSDPVSDNDKKNDVSKDKTNFWVILSYQADLIGILSFLAGDFNIGW